ncbi:hypothetical protein MNB_SM-4-1690 [hydrothermal vent metagenome]|uniref:Uncharacterized protein n=1 Tax=hydrothermal vent metagenome TaxID=652676 RepID=A0A1W1CS84_9ZZZZ
MQTVVIKKYGCFFELNKESESIYLYDYFKGEVLLETRGKLSQIENTLGKRLEQEFDIKLVDFNVEHLDQSEEELLNSF